MTEPRIAINKAQCGKCGDVIESRSRHDFKRCSCGQFFVDGGREYLRRGSGSAGFTELTTYEDDLFGRGSAWASNKETT